MESVKGQIGKASEVMESRYRYFGKVENSGKLDWRELIIGYLFIYFKKKLYFLAFLVASFCTKPLYVG